MNPGISVSRVGGDAQLKFMSKISGGIKLALAQYRELAASLSSPLTLMKQHDASSSTVSVLTNS